MKKEYDVIIIGSGHNGLTCGCYLARAGINVLILERRDNIGGGACTEEVTLPGFKHNIHSIGHTWMWAGPVYKELKLEENGCKYIFPQEQYGMVFLDGKSLMLYQDIEKTVKSIERFSPKDAKSYKKMCETYLPLKDLMMASFYSPPLPLSQTFGLFEGTPEGREMIYIMQSSPKHIVSELFEHDRVKTWMYLMIMQAGTSHDLYGSGMLVILLFPGFHTTPYGLCMGGSRNLAVALAKVFRENGGDIVTKTHVKRVVVENGGATGVELEKGEVIKAKKAVVSNSSVISTFTQLVDEKEIPEEFSGKVKNFKCIEVTPITPHLALNEPPRYHTDNPDVNKAFSVGWGLEDTKEVDEHFFEMLQGIPPGKTGGVAFMPTVQDPTQAPSGKHTAFVYQFTCYDLKNGGAGKWDEIKEEVADRIIEKWRQYAPNLTPENILGRFVYSPLDIEREMISMPRGDFGHGSISLDQMGCFRPFPGWANYRMPIDRFYLCGGSTHPSGGVTAGPGYNAAGVICEDLGVKKWWKPVIIGKK
ncbi:MAG: NAD(P)/FAD-dependent oxidoreductase [Thermodesulfobacteriota bacterium]|nr:NAD(P)/FAD-dependent oxidoreductase [Thermodesulfobacteriota bacterium]